jgi:hypothetical protein
VIASGHDCTTLGRSGQLIILDLAPDLGPNHTAPARGGQELDSRGLQGTDYRCNGFWLQVTATAFKAANCSHADAGPHRQLFLRPVEKGPGGPNLQRIDHQRSTPFLAAAGTGKRLVMD